MKNEFMLNKTGILLILDFIIFPTIATIIVLFIDFNFTYLFILLLPITATILIFSGRKLIFCKISIDDNFITKKYKNEILYQVSWEELKFVKSFNSYLYFLKYDFNREEISKNLKHIIGFSLNKNSLNKILPYRNKFLDKITDISSLSKKYQNLLIEKKN